jgi:hypothetical protein
VNILHARVRRRSAVRFLAAVAILLGVIVAGIALCSGRAAASPGQCVYSGFGGWCDGQYVDPATGAYEHCEWGGFIVYTRNCFLVRPVPADVDPRGWVPA